MICHGHMLSCPHKIFEAYARRIEQEMSPTALRDSSPKEKVCPVCEAKCS